MTPEQALNVLATAADRAPLVGADYRAVQDAVRVLLPLVAPTTVVPHQPLPFPDEEGPA